jgi:hypothetical protein
MNSDQRKPNPRIGLFIAAAVLVGGAVSCAVMRLSNRDASGYGCQLPQDKAQALSVSACAKAQDAGVVMCTPPAPAVAAVVSCESAANGVKLQAIPIDKDRMQQSGSVTQNVTAPIVMPNGEIAAVAACEISRRHGEVVYAVLTRGPTNKAEADFLRDRGVCAN